MESPPRDQGVGGLVSPEAPVRGSQTAAVSLCLTDVFPLGLRPTFLFLQVILGQGHPWVRATPITSFNLIAPLKALSLNTVAF